MIWSWDWKQLQYWTDTDEKKTLLKQTFRIPVEEKEIKKLKKRYPKELEISKTDSYVDKLPWPGIGRVMVSTGLALLNPVGPEDLVSPTPLDEIVGFTLIVGGIIFQVAY